MRSRLSVSAVVLATMALIATSFGPALAAEMLRFGHDQQKSHTYHYVGETLTKQVADATGGALKVSLFPGATLGNEKAMLDSVKSGNLDMAIAASGNSATFLPFLGMFSVSYLFEDENHLKKVLNDPEFTRLVDERVAATNVGFRRIAWFTAGSRNVYNNQRPIMKAADVQDLKLRVMSSPIESKVWGTLGAKPMAIPFGDVYTGMQTGLVQAAENAAAVYAANKHYEVAPHYSMTGHQWMIAFLWMSDKSWNKLSADQQKAVLSAGRGLTSEAIDFAVSSDDDFLKKMSSQYAVQVHKVDRSAFISQLAPLQDEVARELKMEPVLQRIRALR